MLVDQLVELVDDRLPLLDGVGEGQGQHEPELGRHVRAQQHAGGPPPVQHLDQGDRGMRVVGQTGHPAVRPVAPAPPAEQHQPPVGDHRHAGVGDPYPVGQAPTQPTGRRTHGQVGGGQHGVVPHLHQLGGRHHSEYDLVGGQFERQSVAGRGRALTLLGERTQAAQFVVASPPASLGAAEQPQPALVLPARPPVPPCRTRRISPRHAELLRRACHQPQATRWGVTVLTVASTGMDTARSGRITRSVEQYGRDGGSALPRSPSVPAAVT